MTRNSTLAVALACTTIAYVLTAGSTLAARTPITPPPRAESRLGNTINVTGFGEARVTPDVAVIRLGVETQAPTAREAAEANAKTASAVSDAVKRMGVPASHIQTAWYDVSPVYAREEPVPRGEGPVTPRIVGYRVSNVVSVRLEGNLGRVGEVIDTALNAGANRVDGLSWDVRDRSKPLQTAIRRAVRDAQLKAQTIASALKVRLGPPTIVSEQGAAPILEQRVFDRAAGFAAATPISPGTIQITANVVIQFSFR